jgi:hypothetical protein
VDDRSGDLPLSRSHVCGLLALAAFLVVLLLFALRATWPESTGPGTFVARRRSRGAPRYSARR